MPTFKYLRASDKITSSDTLKGGFVSRNNTPIKAIIRILKLITGIVTLVAVLLYYNNIVGVALSLGVGSIIVYLGRKLEHQEKLQHATEFMNALFSSALGDGYKFCAVVRQEDGELIYVNRAFQLRFPSMITQRKHELKSFIDICKIAPEEGQKIMSLAMHGQSGALTASITGTDGQTESMSISISPVPRPLGFSLLRGK